MPLYCSKEEQQIEEKRRKDSKETPAEVDWMPSASVELSGDYLLSMMEI